MLDKDNFCTTEKGVIFICYGEGYDRGGKVSSVADWVKGHALLKPESIFLKWLLIGNDVPRFWR